MKNIYLRFFILCCCLVGLNSAYAQFGGETKVLASSPHGAADDLFGAAVSLDGTRMAVGSYGVTIGSNSYQGAVYIYDFDGTNWVAGTPTRLTAGGQQGQFGYSVSLSGDRLAVGSTDFGAHGNKVYIYDRDAGGNWTLSETLNAPSGISGFNTVSLEGNRLAVTGTTMAMSGNPKQIGYIFEFDGSNWNQDAVLSSSSSVSAIDTSKCKSVSLSGNRVAFGCERIGLGASSQGYAFVFEKNAGTWGSAVEISASDGAANHLFGNALSLDGNRLAVVAQGHSNQGAAYVFDYDGSNWSEYSSLLVPLTSAEGFGFYHDTTISLEGNHLVVGAPNHNSGTGKSYIFSYDGTSWNRSDISASDGVNDNRFGRAVSLSSNRLVVGAEGALVGGNNDQGAVYVYTNTTSTPNYTVTANAGPNGTISPATQTVNHGNTTTFTVTPNAGYTASVSGCGGTLSGTTYTTGTITADCTVTANFSQNSYTVTANAGPNGTISPATQTVNHGNTTTFTVTPNAGYTASVTGCGGTLSGTTYTTGAITADCTVTANFNQNSYTVTANAGPNGTISPATQTVNHGNTTTFTVTPNAGYTANVTGCGGTLSGTTYTTGAITADCTVTADFSQNSYTVTATAGPNGTISPATQTVNHGNTTTFTVTPNAGYAASVTGCGGTLSGTTYTTGAITADCTVTASFGNSSYTVTATAGPNGTISPATQTVNYGSTTTFTVTPNAGYTASVSGCGGTLSGTTYTTGTITADCTVTANFSQNSYTVTANAGPNGTISPATQTVNHGNTTTFTVTPNAGYTASVTGCGGTLSGTTYTTGAITADCTVTANFSQNSYTIGGSISGLSGSVTLRNNGGDDLTLTANGTFTFATAIAGGSSYDVTVSSQPTGQTCTVTNGSGMNVSANVTNVQVSCVDVYVIGGTISGLAGGVILQNNGGDNLTVNADGSFVFSNALPDGATYNITVFAHPAGQTCNVTNGTGTVNGGNINDIQVVCQASTNAAIPVPSITTYGMLLMILGMFGLTWVGFRRV